MQADGQGRSGAPATARDRPDAATGPDVPATRATGLPAAARPEPALPGRLLGNDESPAPAGTRQRPPASVRERRLAEQLQAQVTAEERRWTRRILLRRLAAGGALALASAAALTYAVARPGSGSSAGSAGSAGSGSATRSLGTGQSAAGSSGRSGSPSSSSTIAAVETAAASPAPSGGVSPSAPAGGASASGMAVQMYGTPRSGLPWHSGMWTGGAITTAHSNAAGTWRGTPMDFATTYPLYGTWQEIADSGWAITNFSGFKGKLSYGLPLLPKSRAGKWADVTSGAHDAVFANIARLLVRSGQGDASIRMGPEANGYWFPWAVDASATDEYKAAFRHIVAVMKAQAPRLTFWMDLNCGTLLTGATDRLAPLTQMYPGDDVVDGISMDHYNAYKLQATNEGTWARAIAPPWAPGLADGVAFARVHHKGFALPEWALHDTQGPGDSPYFMQKMFDFFMANRDVLVYENYFSEPDPYIASGLFGTSENPKSAAVYRKLWGRGS